MEDNTTHTFVFFGIVGSGKGTQVKLLTDFLKDKDGKESVYAYPGNEYRRLVESGTFTGRLVKESLNQGNLQPDFITNALFTDILIDGLEPEKHLIADGYPRTLGQSENYESLMKFFKRDKIKIIYIQVGKEEAVKRNKLRGREDDNEAGIARRFDEYVNNVIPSMQYFDGKAGYELFSINGEQSIENVHKEILLALGFTK